MRVKPRESCHSVCLSRHRINDDLRAPTGDSMTTGIIVIVECHVLVFTFAFS